MNVLFFGLVYHQYTNDIMVEMRELGATVDFIDLQPRSLTYKIIRTLFPDTYTRYVSSLHDRLIEDTANKEYGKIVFLQAHQVSCNKLLRLRDLHKSSEFILYNWDSLSNHDYRKQAKYFDRVITFDPQDANAHRFEYLPLFCHRDLQVVDSNKSEMNAIYMLGNIVNLERYFIVKSFTKYCKREGIKFYTHLKVSPVVWFRLLKMGVFPTGVTLRSISKSSYREILSKSSCVFDYANHKQTGQTMRVMENLCAGKKIVTNSKFIKSEPYYSEDRVFVYENEDFEGVSEFLRIPLGPPKCNLENYHIQNFVGKLLQLCNDKNCMTIK